MRDEEQGTQNTFSRPHPRPGQTSRVDNPAERQNDYKKHERQNPAHSGTLRRIMVQSPVQSSVPTKNLSSRQREGAPAREKRLSLAAATTFIFPLTSTPAGCGKTAVFRGSELERPSGNPKSLWVVAFSHDISFGKSVGL